VLAQFEKNNYSSLNGLIVYSQPTVQMTFEEAVPVEVEPPVDDVEPIGSSEQVEVRHQRPCKNGKFVPLVDFDKSKSNDVNVECAKYPLTFHENLCRKSELTTITLKLPVMRQTQ
jgi:hypothetical protein